MQSAAYPVYERGSVIELCVDGIFRIDHLGSKCFVNYFSYDRDPSINHNMIFRVPVLRIKWDTDALLRHRGILGAWLENGGLRDCANALEWPSVPPPGFADGSKH